MRRWFAYKILVNLHLSRVCGQQKYMCARKQSLSQLQAVTRAALLTYNGVLVFAWRQRQDAIANHHIVWHRVHGILLDQCSIRMESCRVHRDHAR
jgi:hypothetical protein